MKLELSRSTLNSSAPTACSPGTGEVHLPPGGPAKRASVEKG